MGHVYLTSSWIQNVLISTEVRDEIVKHYAVGVDH